MNCKGLHGAFAQRAPLTRMRLQGEFIEDGEQQQRLFRDVDEMQAMINSAPMNDGSNVHQMSKRVPS